LGMASRSFAQAGTWTARAPMPIPQSAPTIGVISGKLYVAGGIVGNHRGNWLTVYDPATDTWSIKTPMSSNRIVPMSGVINGKLYVVGGHDDNAVRQAALEIYDPGTDTWTMGAPIPIAVDEAVTAVYNQRLYVFGGTYGTYCAFNNLANTTAVQIY